MPSFLSAITACQCFTIENNRSKHVYDHLGTPLSAVLDLFSLLWPCAQPINSSCIEEKTNLTNLWAVVTISQVLSYSKGTLNIISDMLYSTIKPVLCVLNNACIDCGTCENGLPEPVQASNMLCGSQNGLYKPLQASCTPYGRKNGLHETLQGCNTLCISQNGL